VVRHLARYPGATATNPYPNEEDLKDLYGVFASLGARGVESATADYQLSELAAAIYARGWSYSIDRAGGDFRATVEHPTGDQSQFRAVGIGWSLEAALAFALEKAFTIVERHESLAAR